MAGIENKPVVNKSKVLTRTEREKQREYWRIKKKQSREKQTSQKTRRCKEKDKSYRQACRKGKGPKTTPRGPRLIPKNPESFVSVLETLVQKATPRKKKLLRDKHLINTPKSQKRLKFLEASSSAIKQVFAENPCIKKKAARRLNCLHFLGCASPM